MLQSGALGCAARSICTPSRTPWSSTLPYPRMRAPGAVAVDVVLTGAVDDRTGGEGVGAHPLLAHTRRKRAVHVQPGGDAARVSSGRCCASSLEQQVATATIDRPHLPQVPVELAAAQELGERELFDHRRPAIDVELSRSELLGQLAGRDHPAEAQAGGERLARRPGIHDVIGRETVQRTDGRVVVPVLGVVVVLDDQAVGVPRPVEQLGTALRRHHAPRRELVGRRRRARPPRRGAQRGDIDPVPGDRDTDDLDSRTPGGKRPSGSPGSSTASSRTPRSASTGKSSDVACANPLQAMMLSGCAQVPRTRLRYSARASRSSGAPRPSG